jgi:hypothetical protein
MKMKITNAIKKLKKAGFEVTADAMGVFGENDEACLATWRWYSAISLTCSYKITFKTWLSKLTTLNNEESVETVLWAHRQRPSIVQRSATIAKAIDACLFRDSTDKNGIDAMLLDSQKIAHNSTSGCSKHGACVNSSD